MLQEEHLKEEPEASKFLLQISLFINPISLFSLFPPLKVTYFLFSGLANTEELSGFLVEDRESEIQRTKVSQAETHKLVHNTLQVEWGQGEVINPQEAKELILQVIFLPYCSLLTLILIPL